MILAKRPRSDKKFLNFYVFTLLTFPLKDFWIFESLLEKSSYPMVIKEFTHML